MSRGLERARSGSGRSGSLYYSAESQNGVPRVDSREELAALGDAMDRRTRAALQLAGRQSNDIGHVVIGMDFPEAHADQERESSAPAADPDSSVSNNPLFDGTSDKEQPAPAGQQTEVLEPLPQEQQLQLNFEGISSWVPNVFAKKPPLLQRVARFPSELCRSEAAEQHKKEGKRQVLFNISGSVRPGEILALMGPSGSGKTSLLTVIGGRTPKRMVVDGKVMVAGQPLTKAIRRQIGFVLQDDVMYESLTVHETLLYAALLRLPASMSSAAKRQRVDQVMNVLGLQNTAKTIIGGYLRRGVSGGERKRVSIGHELLINPAVLLLDEPTSGLDATIAHRLILLLKGLALGGRAIVTTIHQPSSRLYQQLDRLMLLAEGHVLYYGDTAASSPWFESFGYVLPYRVNEADFLLDIAMGEAAAPDGSSAHAGEAAVRQLYGRFEQWVAQCPQGVTTAVTDALPRLEDRKHMRNGGARAPLMQSDSANGTDASHRDQLPVSLCALDNKAAATAAAVHKQEHMHDKAEHMAKGKRTGAGYFTQVWVLTLRALKVRRFESLTGLNMIQLVGVALVTGLVWFQRGQGTTLGAGGDIMGLLFFELLFPAFRSLFNALFTFPNEFRMLVKERPSGMYRLSAYYVARTLADLPIEILYPAAFVIIVYFLGGLRLTAAAFFANLFSLLLMTLIAQAWGLIIGGAFMDPKIAQTVTTVLMLTFLLVGGFYVNKIPVWISWIRYLSFVYWGYNLLLKIEFGGRTLRDCPGNGGPCRTVTDLKGALAMPVNPNDSAWLEVVVLLAMLFVLRAGTYYVLRRKTAATAL